MMASGGAREWSHFGLFFGAAERALARATRQHALLARAWSALEQPPADRESTEQEQARHALALWGGTRYRFAEDAAAGKRALLALRELLAANADAVPGDECPRPVGPLLAQAQILELLRPLLGDEGERLRQAWRTAWQGLPPAREYDERAQDALLRFVAGVLLEEEAYIAAGTTAFREAISAHLHPEGYWKPAVGDEMGAAAAGSFARQLRATEAYALLAEANEQLPGRPSLWNAHARHVSIRTAIAYCAYYHFYPEHWRWEAAPLAKERAAALFRRHGAFLEIAARRAPTQPLPLLLRQLRGEAMDGESLDDLRPLVGVYGGGWTTLAHGGRMPAPPSSIQMVWQNLWRQLRSLLPRVAPKA